MSSTAENLDNAVPGGNDSEKKRLADHQGADHETVRKFNRQLILTHLREDGPRPRVTIAQNLGLSRATVSSIIDGLLIDGWVREGKKVGATSKGGRRATQIHFNADAGYTVGIDIGRSHLRMYLTNLEPEIVDRWSGRLDMKVGGKESLPFIADVADTLVQNKLGTWDRVRGIGLGIAGIPDRSTRMLVGPPLLLDNWKHIDIPASLRSRLRLDEHFPIYLDNDANMGTLGESRYGAGRGITNLVYVKLSTGISAGLILNGQLYRGSNGVAGEFGHVLIENDSPRACPSCGKHGCLEALTSIPALVDDARRSSSSPRIQALRSSTITPELMADVIIAAQEGDTACHDVLKRAGVRIGKAIGGYLINMYNPSLILLDGGIVRPGKGDTIYMNWPLLEFLHQSAEASSMAVVWAGTKISTGQLGDDAVGLGAIATVIDHDPELNMPDGRTLSLSRAILFEG